jgi:hypothetical protein
VWRKEKHKGNEFKCEEEMTKYNKGDRIKLCLHFNVEDFVANSEERLVNLKERQLEYNLKKRRRSRTKKERQTKDHCSQFIFSIKRECSGYFLMEERIKSARKLASEKK